MEISQTWSSLSGLSGICDCGHIRLFVCLFVCFSYHIHFTRLYIFNVFDVAKSVVAMAREVKW